MTKKFREIDSLIENIDLFKYNNNTVVKNQLFSIEPPPFELVKKIVYTLINKELNDKIYYEFSKKNIMKKNIIDKIDEYIILLKDYYLKCKHNKYLENLNEKKNNNII